MYSGDIDVSMSLTMDADTVTKFASGNAVASFPSDGYLMWATMRNHRAKMLSEPAASAAPAKGQPGNAGPSAGKGDGARLLGATRAVPMLRVPVGGMYARSSLLLTHYS